MNEESFDIEESLDEELDEKLDIKKILKKFLINILIVLNITTAGIISYFIGHKIGVKMSGNVKYKLEQEYDLFKNQSQESYNKKEKNNLKTNSKNNYIYAYNPTKIKNNKEFINLSKTNNTIPKKLVKTIPNQYKRLK